MRNFLSVLCPVVFRKKWLSVMALAATATLASAQLYEQTFPFVAGNSAAFNNVGWQVINPPNGYSGSFAFAHTNAATLQPISGNPLYLGSGDAGTGMFYTTNGAGTGPNGTSAFTSIDPLANPGLTLNIYANLQGPGAFSYFAVEVGGLWYVSATAMTTPTSSGPNYDLRSLPYDPAAGLWNNLTVTATTATIGGAAGALSGPITGVGIVEVVPGGFNNAWNYADFTITVPEPATWALLGLGALVFIRRAFRRSA